MNFESLVFNTKTIKKFSCGFLSLTVLLDLSWSQCGSQDLWVILKGSNNRKATFHIDDRRPLFATWQTTLVLFPISPLPPTSCIHLHPRRPSSRYKTVVNLSFIQTSSWSFLSFCTVDYVRFTLLSNEKLSALCGLPLLTPKTHYWISLAP